MRSREDLNKRSSWDLIIRKIFRRKILLRLCIKIFSSKNLQKIFISFLEKIFIAFLPKIFLRSFRDLYLIRFEIFWLLFSFLVFFLNLGKSSKWTKEYQIFYQNLFEILWRIFIFIRFQKDFDRRSQKELSMRTS